MRIALFFDKHGRGTVGRYFERAFEALGVPHDYFWTRRAHAGLTGYDLYVRIDHGDYRYDLPPTLRPAVFYAVDTHLRKPWRAIQRQARHYDLICCAQHEVVPQFPRAVWLPFGCDLALHQQLPLPKRYDVAFVGTEGAIPRKFLLQALRERYPSHFIGHAHFTQMGSLYSQAKIGFHYIGLQTKAKSYVSMRVPEVMACGALMITNATPDGSLEAMGLRDRRELVCYRSFHEIYPLIDYYLEHDDERDTIARAGCAVMRSRHTYQHRAWMLLEETVRRLRRQYPQLGALQHWMSARRADVTRAAVGSAP